MSAHTAVARRILSTDADLDVDQRVARLSREFGTRIVALVSTADITVVDTTSCEAAVAVRSTIGELQKEIQAAFEPEKSFYYNKHKEVCGEENTLLAQLVNPK